MVDVTEDSARAAELAARTAYGRLVGILAARNGDIAAAEDALSEAFSSALTAWPRSGVPASPEAWLLTAAKRKLTDQSRRNATAAVAETDLVAKFEEIAMDGLDPDMPDPRLGLMFLCAHPAIDPTIRTPLMLQTVMGLSADRIASVYLVKPSAMSGRLVRAKSKIKVAGIPFGIPDRDAWTERLDAVLAAIYGAYTVSQSGDDDSESDLRGEAEWLSRLLVDLLPLSGESKGLLSLILFCEARRPAKTGMDGAYIPLSEQDPSLWDTDLTAEAQNLLQAASKSSDGGRYQIEAAIQSVHALRAVTGKTDWPMLLHFYDVLVATAPSLGAVVARAAVLAEAQSPDDALAALSDLPADRVAAYGPYHATIAHCFARLGRTEDAYTAYQSAIDLAPDKSVASWLRTKANQLTS